MASEVQTRSPRHMARFSPASPKPAPSKRLSKGSTCSKSPVDSGDVCQSPQRNVRKSPFAVSTTTPQRKLKSSSSFDTPIWRRPTRTRSSGIQNSPRKPCQQDRPQVESPLQQSQGASSWRFGSPVSPPVSRAELVKDAVSSVSSVSSISSRERTASSLSGTTSSSLGSESSSTSTMASSSEIPQRQKSMPTFIHSPSPNFYREPEYAYQQPRCSSMERTQLASKQTDYPCSDAAVQSGPKPKPARILSCSNSISAPRGNSAPAQIVTRAQSARILSCSSSASVPPCRSASVQKETQVEPSRAQSVRILSCSGSISVPPCGAASVQKETHIESSREKSARVLSSSSSASVPPCGSAFVQKETQVEPSRAQSVRILSRSGSVSVPSCGSASVLKETHIGSSREQLAPTLSSSSSALVPPCGCSSVQKETQVKSSRICRSSSVQKEAQVESSRILTCSASAPPPRAASQQLPRQSPLLSGSISSPQGFGQSPDSPQTRQHCGGLIVEELQISSEMFDLTLPSFRGILFEKLGLQAGATIRKLEKTHGGLNYGIYTVQDNSRTLILKMATSTRYMGIPTEAESLVSLSKRVPSIQHDRDVAFPIRVFLLTAKSQATRNLIVMEKVAGQPLATIITRKLQTDHRHDLKGILQQFGTFLAAFHKRYGMQHCDCQPGNIFFDESSGRFSLIDVSELGSPLVKKLDVEHFCDGLLVLMREYGQQFCDECSLAFKKGYSIDPHSPL